MFNELITMIYNSKEHRLRGSFITASVTAIVWVINLVIMYLVYHQVMSGNEKLASIAIFVSVWLGFVKVSYIYITTTYMNNKSAIEMEETRQRLAHPPDKQPGLVEAKNDVPVDSEKDIMYEK